MKRHPLALDRTNDLGRTKLVVHLAGQFGRISLVLPVRPAAKHAEYGQSGSEDGGKKHELPAFGFEESDEFRRRHGFSILLFDTEFVSGAAIGSVIG
jgi:hypothetical protein